MIQAQGSLTRSYWSGIKTLARCKTVMDNTWSPFPQVKKKNKIYIYILGITTASRGKPWREALGSCAMLCPGCGGSGSGRWEVCAARATPCLLRCRQPRARDGLYVKGSPFNLKGGFILTLFCSLAWVFI